MSMFRRALDFDEPTPAPRAAYWHEIPSPIGPLLLASGEDGRVRRVTFREGRESFVDDLLRRGWLPLRDADPNAQLVSQLDEYFKGQRKLFDLSVDLETVAPFTRRVLEATAQVPRGGWDTYGQLALTIGHPRAARAVGNALGENPIPIVIPCHRILAAGGRIGGYSSGLPGGLDIKRKLLSIEGVSVA